MNKNIDFYFNYNIKMKVYCYRSSFFFVAWRPVNMCVHALCNTTIKYNYCNIKNQHPSLYSLQTLQGLRYFLWRHMCSWKLLKVNVSISLMGILALDWFMCAYNYGIVQSKTWIVAWIFRLHSNACPLTICVIYQNVHLH